MHPFRQNSILLISTYQKRGCLHLPVRRSRPSTAIVIELAEQTPTQELHIHTIKCAWRAQSTLAAHYGVAYNTPRGRHICICP